MANYAGEDFLDYFDGNFNSTSFMFWARGKNYISVEQLNLWEKASRDVNSLMSDSTKVIYSCYEELAYAVVSEEDWTQEGQDKAYRIFAEFISESVIYQDRLREFIQEN